MATKNRTRIIAVVTMIFLFGMISFVTNLAAPLGNIWKAQPGIDNSNTWGMMGNMMNFLAYLIMGIPAGKILSRRGYKTTALMAIAVGLTGVIIQFLSGILFVNLRIGDLPANFFVYLLGAFVSGFCVCMLNTVVNPMLNIVGGGGNRGNQYIQIGGTMSSLVGTLTPMLVGAMIGQLSHDTAISDVNVLLFIAMAVFAITFAILFFIPIDEPKHDDDKTHDGRSPWQYRHFVLGAVAIFLYVGVEVGIPGTLNFYLSDSSERGAGLIGNAVAVAGFAAGTYWFMMLIGRLVSTLVASKMSSRAMLTIASAIGIALVLMAIVIPHDIKVVMPVFTGSSFQRAELPLSALLLVAAGLCTSVMWGTIFNLSVDGLGRCTEEASGIFMMLVVGGGIVPLIQNALADSIGYMMSYLVTIVALLYILFYALIGSRHINKVK